MPVLEFDHGELHLQSPCGKSSKTIFENIDMPQYEADDASDPVFPEPTKGVSYEQTVAGEAIVCPEILLSRPPSMKSIKSQAPRLAAVAPTKALPDTVSSYAGVAPSLGVPNNLPRLMPSQLAPRMRLPKMSQLWAFLDRIECVTVSDVYTYFDGYDSSGTVYYTLDVYYYQERQGIPTHRSSSVSSSPPARHPDCQVHHRFSSFLKLQRRLRKAARCQHEPVCPRRDEPDRPHRCAFCQQINHFTSTAGLNWKAKLFSTVGMRMPLLSQFVAELLVLTRQQRHACRNLETLRLLYQPSNASVERSVPGLVRQFLTAQTGETFMQ